MTRPQQLEGTWAPAGARRTTGRRGEHGAHEQHGAVTLGWLLPPQTDSALSCAPLRSSAISRGLARRPQAHAAPAAPTRHAAPRPVGATPRRRASMAVATAVQRSFLRGGRRVSFAGRRSSVFGTPAHTPARRAAVARSRFASSGRRERARPPRDATRGNGAVHGALDLRWVIWGCLGHARAAPSSLLFSTQASKPASSRLSNSQVRASQNSRRQPPPASARDCCFVFVFVSNRAAVKSSRTAAVKPSSQEDRGEFLTELR